MSNIICGHCKHYNTGKVFGTKDDVKRGCIPKDKKVSFVDKSCMFFSPNEYFTCEKHGDRIQIPICLIRRSKSHSSELTAYNDCKKCRQFDTEIRDIVVKYFVEMQRPRKFKSKVILDTQKQQLDEKSSKRKIKRRSKQTNKKIKRRKKKTDIIIPEPKKKRKIRRRKN